MDAGRRLLQGSVAAGVSTWLALAFHLLAGGDFPALAGLVIPFVLSWCACVALAAWRTDVLRLSASVVASQALFHTLFVLGSAGQLNSGHAHAGTGGLDPTSTHLVHSSAGSQMWLAHLGAAVITILALRSSEQEFSRLLRLAVDFVRRLVLPCIDVAVLSGPGVLLPSVPELRVGQGLERLAGTVTLRGPPVGARLR